ncbi:MAG: aminotransferase class I/II-fold pyridoxal phosphate-dependent enzyme [Cyanobacteria bacterium P01_F01_bin.4]
MVNSSKDINRLTVAEKRQLLTQLLQNQAKQIAADTPSYDLDLPGESTPGKRPQYLEATYDMFIQGGGTTHDEVDRFNQWVEQANREGIYAFEAPRLQGQKTEVEVQRSTGETLKMLNFSSYNYLGYGNHPDVIAAAKDALDRYGLGAASAPVTSGTFRLHQQLEQRLIDFFGLPGYGVSLFSSGYGVNTGTISAYMKPGSYVILDQAAHMCMLEGAKLSGAKILYFRHNDIDHLEAILKKIADGQTRILVGTEGVYSADGDYGEVGKIVQVAKKYGAKVLADEAHSMLLAGPNGRGVCEAQGVLAAVDFIVITFSKSFGGVGGALVAKKEIAQYVNWYARCRMFSCALAPAVTGGVTKALELASGDDGDKRRKRIRRNAELMRSQLAGKVNIGDAQSWVIPVIYGLDKQTMPLNDYLQREGLDTSIMQFPATPRNEARIRLFVTSEHTPEQISQATQIILKAADKFNFLR